MKAALPRDVSLNILFVIDICKLTLEEKGKLQEDLFGVGAYWSNGQRVIIEEARIIQLDIILYILIEE